MDLVPTTVSAMWQLQQFVGGYLHQDFDLEFKSPDEAVTAYGREFSAEAVAVVIAELDRILSSSISESEMYELWIKTLHASYDPAKDGLTYREWFAHVRDLLTRARDS